jgi:hypothetical protein
MREEVTEQSCSMWRFMSSAARRKFSGDRLVEQEMGEIFSVYGGRGKCKEDFDGEN